MQETVLQPPSFPDQGTAGKPHPALPGTGNANNMEFIFSSLEGNVDYLQLLMCTSQSSSTSLPKEMGKSASLEQHLDQLWTHMSVCVWARDDAAHWLNS